MRFIILILLFFPNFAFSLPTISLKQDSIIISDSALRVPLVIKDLHLENPLVKLSDDRYQAILSSKDLLLIDLLEKGMTLHLIPLVKKKEENIKLSFDLDQNEFVSGLTERVIDGPDLNAWKKPTKKALNLNGESVNLTMQGTLSLYAPFFISSRGYSLEILGTAPASVDFGRSTSHSLKLLLDSERASIHFDFSSDPLDLVKSFTLRSGPPVALPEWAFKQWRWRNEHTNSRYYSDGSSVTGPYNSEVMEDILGSKALGILLGVYWVDRPWAVGKSGYDDFEWDEARFPKFNEMISWIRDQGVQFGIWIAPALSGEMLKKGEASEFLLKPKNLTGEFPGLLDFRNPAALSFWKENGINKLLDLGIKVFKLDRGDESFPEVTTLKELKNNYPHLYAKSVHEIASEKIGSDFALLARAAYTGSNRYAAFWGGDISGTELGLRSSIIGVQRAAIMGYPFWGSDTGGYSGKLDKEILARWIAFSTFTPIMEIGPLKDRAIWDLPLEPSYDKELLAIYHFYSQLRETLVPYLFDLSNKARETGAPLITPIWIAFHTDPRTLTEWQSFMLGEDLLVHPIWKKGEERETIYLPKDSDWRDLWNPDEIIKGGQEIHKVYSIHEIPLFAKANSKFSLGDLKELYNISKKAIPQRISPALLEEKESW